MGREGFGQVHGGDAHSCLEYPPSSVAILAAASRRRIPLRNGWEYGPVGPASSAPARPCWLAYATDMSAKSDRARVEDVHELALGMPHVTVERGPRGNPVYQVGGKSFVFFRNPRADATDPETGERYTDVIVFWVASESDKQAMVQDPAAPFFTTPHFDGHRSVLLRSSRIGELTRQELAEVVQDAWLAQASDRRRATWLDAHAAQ